MDADLNEIHRFIHHIVPFDGLPNDVIAKITRLVIICYARRGTLLPPGKVTDPRLYLVRKGVLSYLSVDGELLGKAAENDICSFFMLKDKSLTDTVHHDERACHEVKTDEDTLLYSIPFEPLMQLLEPYQAVQSFFIATAAQRLQQRVSRLNDDAIVHSTLLNLNIADFYRSPALTIDGQSSVRQAAVKMTELNVSSLMVLEGEQLTGIVTDRDIRKRCVAQGLSFELSIGEIMSVDLITIESNSTAFDALILMSTRQIHHLPVTTDGVLVGMVSATDLLNQEGQNAVSITSVIHKAQSPIELADISKLIPKLQHRMAKTGTTADHVGKSISAITTAFTCKLIQMAENKLGPAPVPYAWVGAGSQARQEQCCHSDQDNALIISDDFKPEHDDYFLQLATFVSDGLAACGYVYCPGEVMATNKKWRQPKRVWQNYFRRWIEQPEPEALLHGSIFFDLHLVFGQASLVNDIRRDMLAKTRGNSLFLAHLSRNALMQRPPLGFFRDFVLHNQGEHRDMLNLKQSGISLIVDLARIYALAEGVSAVNTIERLKQVAGSPSLTKTSAASLIDAFEFLGMLRISHQAKQIGLQQAPDNYLSPKAISTLEREHLKDAFKVIKLLQQVLKQGLI